jgi:signal-transduction protein with cAMP-binding, CBS, and nucleotidyltransferase domain
MPQTIADVMTDSVVAVDASDPVTTVAQQMRDRDVGDVMVMRGGSVCGILTDRDLVVRGLASGLTDELAAGDLCSTNLLVVTPATSVNEAAQLMADHAVRRVPVIQGDLPVGMVSLGDLAIGSNEDSVLRRISAAPANG